MVRIIIIWVLALSLIFSVCLLSVLAAPYVLFLWVPVWYAMTALKGSGESKGKKL